MHVIRGDELDTVSLQLAHVTWFVSIKYSGGLNIGIYEGDDGEWSPRVAANAKISSSGRKKLTDPGTGTNDDLGMVIMKDNTRTNHPSQPGNITPLNGHHIPEANSHLDGLSAPLPGEFSAVEFDNFLNPEADDLGRFFPPQGSLASGEFPDATVSTTSSTVDGDSLPHVPTNAGTGALVPVETELLPSAGFVTPSKLSYYSKLAEAPRLDLDFIKAEARAGNADGESRVAAHHGQLWGMARAGLRQTLAEKHTSVVQNLQHLGDDVTRTRKLLGATRQFDDVPGAEPALHWTWPDRLAATFWAGFATAGVAMDFFTWATILRQNDEHFFHNPSLAFFFGAVPLCLPLSIKVLLGGMTDEDGNDRALRGVAWLGIAACLGTIGFFTLGHVGMSDAGTAGFGSLSGSDGGPSALDWKLVAQKASSMLLMVVAAIFSAISCHFLVGMFKRRRRAGRTPNPQYTLTARRLARLQANSHEERETLGAIDGKLRELVDEANALVGSAVNYYRELRTALTQAEQRLAELLQGPGGTPKLTLGQKLKKGGQALGVALAALTTVSLGACGRSGSAASSPTGLELPASAHVASHVVLGLSPQMNKTEREQVWSGVGQLILSSLPVGGTFEAWDALELHRICAFTIPSDPFFAANPNARQKIAAPALAELRRWLGQPAPAEEVVSPRIIEPQFLDTIARSVRRPGEDMALLLAGSAIYTHPRDGKWALVDEQFHNDGHFGAPPEITPFSVLGREQALHSTVIFHAFLRDDFRSEAQREGEQRFLALWIKQQQGTLATFTRDISVAFDNLSRGATRPILDPVLRPEDDKPGMRTITIQPVNTATGTTAPLEQRTVTSEIERVIGEIPDEEKRATRPPASPIVPNVQIGFKWSAAGIDVDGYAAHHPGAPELHYACLRAPEGRFWKDWQTAPTGVVGVNGFEIISFERSTDLTSAECWVNLYRGHTPRGVDVTVQIVLDDEHRYSSVVHIPAEDGNRGANSAGRSHDAHWTRVNLAEIVGLAHPVANR